MRRGLMALRFNSEWSGRTLQPTNLTGVGSDLWTAARHGKCCGRSTTSEKCNHFHSFSWKHELMRFHVHATATKAHALSFQPQSLFDRVIAAQFDFSTST